jgi:uncharacterized damage-inducible protein DinB
MTSIDLLLSQLDQAYNRHSWHGTNLRGSIRGLTPDQAAWRPAPGRHNIHEEVVHCAYWKYTATRRLTGEKRGSFPLEGSNWFPRTGADAAQWKADIQLLDACHRRLRDTVERLSPRDLARPLGTTTAQSLVSGIIAHDLYHAGQIQLLKRLASEHSS